MQIDQTISILLVDDTAAMSHIMCRILKQLRFENVKVAADGTAALAMMHQYNFKLVISDLHMRPMPGDEFLRQVRADPQLAHTPFILVTAEKSAEFVSHAKDAGASAIIFKPFKADALRAKIEEALTSAIRH